MDEQRREALHHALHSFSGSKERWEKRRATGLTDADLSEAISKEFGSWGGQSYGIGNTHCGEKPPRIWFGNAGDGQGRRRKPDLQGKALVAVVREFLRVPLPKAAPAPAPWAGLPLMQMMEARG
jgi:hypothetical protein